VCGVEEAVIYCEEYDLYVCEACCEECGECDLLGERRLILA